MSDAILSRLDQMEAALRSDLNRLRTEVGDLRTAVTESNENVLKALQALHTSHQETRDNVRELKRA